MTPFGLQFPLTKAGQESVQVVDRAGATAAYVYICDEPQRRQQTNRMSRKDGIAAAKVMAGALPDSAAVQEAGGTPQRSARSPSQG